jgi:hypothetical protein
MINSRKMKWAVHIARMEAIRNAYKTLIGNPEEDRNAYYRNRARRCGMDSSGSGEGPVAGCCEQSNGLSRSIKVE